MSAVARVEAVRYEDLQPFLDAITTVKSGRPMQCPANNLDLLPRRDAPLEVIAQLAPVRERIEPYVERAKLQIIESIRSRQADRRR